MPKFCAVYKCGNRSDRDTKVNFYNFPRVKDTHSRPIPQNIERRKLWIAALHRADFTEEKAIYGYICSKHFTTGQPVTDPQHPDFVPSIEMGYEQHHKKKMQMVERWQRSRKRIKEIDEQDNFNSEIEDNVGGNIIQLESQQSDERTKDSSTQTPTYVNEDVLLHEELYQLREAVEKLTLNEKSFEGDNKKSSYFSGLPTYSQMKNVFSLVEPYIKITPNSAVKDKFTVFLITLIKLRFNIPFTYLGYQFNVSRYTISRIFFKTLHIMYCRFKKFVFWPSREVLQRTMPLCFKENFGNSVAVVIDCFEIFLEKSSNLEAQASTWSNYKHHNTIKYLIGMTPQGAISFISSGYGGRVSDTLLTEDCGILNKLLPGDVILADRGFLIADIVNILQAKVNTPAFVKQRKQLQPREIEDTRQIANVRVHVERVIGSLRQKFTLLHQVLPIAFAKKKTNDHVSDLDKVLTVCSALVNLCPPIIPFE